MNSKKDFYTPREVEISSNDALISWGTNEKAKSTAYRIGHRNLRLVAVGKPAKIRTN